MVDRLYSFFHSDSGCRQWPLTLIRITFGLFYFALGLLKLFVPINRDLMLETMSDAGVPFPEFMAVLVASCEALFGLLLALGALTRLSALVLLVISLLSLITAGVYLLPMGYGVLVWYSSLFFLPETGYILMSLLLLVQDSGPLGIDKVLARRNQPKAHTKTRRNAHTKTHDE